MLSMLRKLRPAFACIFLLLPAIGHSTDHDSLNKADSRTAPQFENTTWLRQPLDPTVLTGKVVLVNFWATWCPPCVEELPSIQKVYEAFDRKNFEVVAVNVGENIELIQQFLERLPVKLNFNFALDKDLSIYRDWQVRPLPTTYLIDRHGRIRYSAVGSRDYASDGILAIIRDLINEQ